MSITVSKLYNTLFKNATRKSPSPNISSLRYYDKDGTQPKESKKGSNKNWIVLNQK
jgi:hypothetical protein